MSTDASGNYTLPGSDLANGTTADATPLQQKLDDLETGMTERLTKTGKTTASANQPMGGFKHTDVDDATARTEYARADQVQDSALTYALTSGADTMTATLAPAITAYVVGQTYTLKKDANANTGAVTLNLGPGAGAVTWPDGTALAADDLPASCMFQVAVSVATPAFRLLNVGKPVMYLAGNQTITNTKTFTGAIVATGATVTVATAAAGDNDTSVASTAFVQTAVAARTAVADANVGLVDTSRVISFTSLTANRNVTLPAANTVTAGRAVDIFDASGSASESISIRLVPNGTDTIAGSNTTQTCINIPRGSCRIVCNGTDGWNVEKWSVRYVNTLGADVNLNNAANYFTGPTVAQGSVGTWFCSGQVAVTNTAGADSAINVKLWDGTTVIASGSVSIPSLSSYHMISLSGYLTTPGNDIAISARDPGSTTGLVAFNVSGNSKDCTLNVTRVA